MCCGRCTSRRGGATATSAWRSRPTLARDTAGTLAEARRLWQQVARPNVMIKVPATPEGIPAIEQLISEGINVNVTLLFAQEAYEEVARAYIAGLEKRAAQGGDLQPRGQRGQLLHQPHRHGDRRPAYPAARDGQRPPANKALLRSLMGKVAIANAKLTYQRYQEMFRGARWQALADQGAQTQRPLWASTSTKNPAYRDVIYVEELIGPDTVNTMPPATFDAFRDHGRPRASLTEDVDEACDTMETLARVGISMKEVTDNLLDDGVQSVRRRLRQAARCRRENAAGGRDPQDHPADLHAAGAARRRGAGHRSRTGARGTRSAACGRAMPRCGPAPTRATGWAGSGSPTTSGARRHSETRSRQRPRAS